MKAGDLVRIKRTGALGIVTARNIGLLNWVMVYCFDGPRGCINIGNLELVSENR